MERLDFEIKQDRSFESKKKDLDKKIKKWIGQRSSSSYTIPVVFHVLFEDENETININPTQI